MREKISKFFVDAAFLLSLLGIVVIGALLLMAGHWFIAAVVVTALFCYGRSVSVKLEDRKYDAERRERERARLAQ